jgi:hypothetical protein
MVRERIRVAEVFGYLPIVTRDEMLSEFTNPWPGFVLSDLCGHGFDTQPRDAQDFVVGAAFHRLYFLANLWHAVPPVIWHVLPKHTR